MTRAPRGTIRAAQREMTRTRLVAGAVAVFAERGYSRTTVDEIAEAAGTTRATFYLHFKTKSDILPELLAKVSSHFENLYKELANVSVDPSYGTVRQWIIAAMNEWTIVADFARPLLEAAMVEPGVRGEVYPQGSVPVSALADALLKSSHITDIDDAMIYANVLLAPLNHYFQIYLRAGEFNRDHVADVLATTWVAVMSASITRTD